MKLSISNIAWEEQSDEQIYEYLYSNGIEGLEIAPTRIFSEGAYDKLKDAKQYAKYIKNNYSLEISSMQSVWFGRDENIFKNDQERDFLIQYTKKAIDFAAAIGCKNIVFGCPKNRRIDNSNINYRRIAINFFKELGDYAFDKNTVISIEPNPIIYNTNFINTTEEAFEFVKEINNRGIMVNVDLGTIINNNEGLDIIRENIGLINHIHVSEPYLEKIENRQIHRDLANILSTIKYDRYISIEMKNLDNLNLVKDTLLYVMGIFK